MQSANEPSGVHGQPESKGAKHSITTDSMSDAELVHLWQSGNVAAGTTLLQRYTTVLHRYFRSRFLEYSDDLIQQTYLVCTQNIVRVRNIDKFPAFLMGVARRVSLEHMRKNRVRAARDIALTYEPTPANDTPSQVTSLREGGRKLMQAVKDLPPQWQLAIILHYWHGLSVAEVAQIQNVAEGTVKSWLARSRSQLKRKLWNLLPPPAE